MVMMMMMMMMMTEDDEVMIVVDHVIVGAMETILSLIGKQSKQSP